MNVFCSYHFVEKQDSGFGNIMLSTDEPFPLPLSEIRRFEREIKERNRFKGVVLLNYQILGEWANEKQSKPTSSSC